MTEGPNIPRAPRGLSAAGRAEWRRILATLAARGDFARFLPAVEALISSQEALRTAEGEIKGKGFTLTDGRRNPALAVADRLRKQIDKGLKELALTPASEARLLGKRGKAPDDAGDSISPDRPERGWLDVDGRRIFVEDSVEFLLSRTEDEQGDEEACAYWQAVGSRLAVKTIRARGPRRRVQV